MPMQQPGVPSTRVPKTTGIASPREPVGVERAGGAPVREQDDDEIGAGDEFFGTTRLDFEGPYNSITFHDNDVRAPLPWRSVAARVGFGYVRRWEGRPPRDLRNAAGAGAGAGEPPPTAWGTGSSPRACRP